MDGAFLDLDAETVEGEVDEYNRDMYKVQKVFNTKVKKLQMEVEERNRDKKKRRRQKEESGEDVDKEDEDEQLHLPAAVTVCTTVQDQMRDFKVVTCI